MARPKPRRVPGRRGGVARAIPDIVTVARFIVRPEVVGTLLVVLAAAALPSLLPLASVLTEGRDALVRLFGLHVFSLTLALAATGALLALRRTAWAARHRRHLLGVAALLVLAAGALGRWYPASTIGSVDLATTSAGGDAGRLLTRGTVATALWAAMLPLAFALLWPRTAVSLLRASPRAAARGARALWRLGLHRSAGRALLATVRRAISRRDLDAAADGRAVDAGRRDYEPPQLVSLPDSSSDQPATDDAVAREPAAADGDGETDEQEQTAAQMPMDMEIPVEEWRHSTDGWQLPPITLLKDAPPASGAPLDNERRSQLIIDTLASFGVDGRVTQINEGPAVTQFGIEPGWDVRTRTVAERDASGQPLLDERGQPRLKEVEVSRTRVRVNRITALQNDLALALAAPALRIEAPVPGKQMVGIEVPNTTTTIVTLRSVMESQALRKLARRAALPVALGAGVSGEPVVADLGGMPHLLIAGATGSGKSVCLNSIITCLLMTFSPAQLRLVLIDPKRVELTAFAKVPHLAFSEIVVDLDRVVGTLQAVINEMESRYRRFAQLGVRDIRRYNAKVKGRGLPYWVVVIDELADLMLSAPYQVESQVVRIAQLARATGIHLVIATQRPSVDVVTGLIKANFPTRIAFAVASQVDSRTVLDQGGAEKLLGRGDMLYLPTDAQKPRRLQGVFVSDEETEAVVGFWSSDRFEAVMPEKHDELLREAERQIEHAESGGVDERDPMYQRALDLAHDSQRLSTSMLQRRLRVGYPRAARIMDELEERGVVGPAETGGSSRQVLLEAEGVGAPGGDPAAGEPPPADGAGGDAR